jgi:two-component system, LuxR family, sensor kinase FixL
VLTVGELTAAVSHELRQPLAAIGAHADAGALLLAQSPPDVTEARLIFEDIAADNVRANEVIEHMRLLLSKHRQDPSQLIDLNQVCSQAVRLIERSATDRGVTIELSLSPELPPVQADPVQLQQVVLNLALNAVDAAALSSGERAVTVGTGSRQNKVELFVRDTGPGLTSHVQSHLFHSFFSTKPRGLGLGLAIVRAIVEQHHGTVQAASDARGGAVFRVLLPAAGASSSSHRRAQLNQRLIHGVHPD